MMVTDTTRTEREFSKECESQKNARNVKVMIKLTKSKNPDHQLVWGLVVNSRRSY